MFGVCERMGGVVTWCREPRNNRRVKAWMGQQSGLQERVACGEEKFVPA